MPPGIRQTGMVPLDLGPGCRVVLEARAPADDSNVSGVVVSDAIFFAEDVTGLGFDILPGPPLLANLPRG